MDHRIAEHAEVLVDWSARIDSGDNVVVSVDAGAHPLGVAVAGAIGARGGNLVTTSGSDEITRAYLHAHPGDFEQDPAHELGLYEEADAVLLLRGTRNTSTMGDVPGSVTAAYRRTRQGIADARLATDWVATVHPTRALAQQADMAIEAYRDFVYGAILRDWEALAGEMAQLKARLDAGSTVRIDAPGTEITLSIEDRVAVNSAASVDFDSHNLPSGEVFTAPAGATGEMTFDLPMTIDGRQVRDVRLVFENGVVVDHEADRNESVLSDILETDDGARRVGELGFGMNRNIDRITNNILFDEKMGDTIHLAVGRPYAACFSDGTPSHDSAVHVDLIADVREESRVWIDEELVQQNGRFAWEEGFEGP